MVSWIVKRVICRNVNKVLSRYGEDVAEMRDTVRRWISRLSRILACLESIVERIDDNELSADEVADSAEDIKTIVREW